MSIHSGSPHILLFERDQQLTALLMSEFQLAGYECHAARTAVEVFDAIARFPVRLVLVNLAQAAAGRREFWVALDAQRRGRGVQVFTFRCMNIAGYGVDDPDERARIVLTDMEVDGMLGVMNLVDAVRARIPVSSTGSFSRVNPASQVRDSARLEAIRPASQPGFAAPAPSRPPAAQATAPLSMLNESSSSPMPAVQPAPTAPPVASVPPFASQQQAASPNVTEQAVPPRIQPSTFTDKIRAVMRPGNRGVSTNPEANWVPYSSPAQAQRPTRTDQPDGTDFAIRPAGAGLAAAQPMQSMPPAIERAVVTSEPDEETGLAQLSRMVKENVAPYTTNAAGDAMPAQARAAMPPPAPAQPRPVESPSLGDLPLRASPIEDLPDERLPERRNGSVGTSGSAVTLAVESTQDSITPTLHLSAVNPPAAGSQGRVREAENAVTPSEQPVEVKHPGKGDNAPAQSMKVAQNDQIDALFVEQGGEGVPEIADGPEVAAPPEAQGAPGMSEVLTAAALRRRSEHNVTSEDVLLNIVQSLPPMNALPTPVSPPAPPQAPVLSGRATRSLAHVLLDGHLVPKDRLEVAQSIQRMLRGVDMNYQLGEILLMFKLLTPDQLLAASLVSYGMISAVQISALGRIRQELHSMGLEYDLESLLVLFRMLTSEQLREVRASWTG